MSNHPGIDASLLPHELAARGRDLLERAATTRICICGAGALGGTLAEHLARSGWRQLRVVVDDRVATSNLACQPYQLRQVGQAKVVALAALLYEVAELEIDQRCLRLTPRSSRKLLRGADIVVDCFDNVESRLSVRDACAALEIPCLHVGLGGAGYADLRPSAGYEIAAPGGAADPCEIAYSRSLVQIAVALTAEALCRFLAGEGLSAREIPLDALWRACAVPFGARHDSAR